MPPIPACPSSRAFAAGQSISRSPLGGGAPHPVRTPGGGGPILEGSARSSDLNLDDLCSAYEAMLSILSAIGPALMIQVRNDNNNLRKLRAAMASTGCTTIRSLLLAEIAA